MTPCSLEGWYHRFGEQGYCPHFRTRSEWSWTLAGSRREEGNRKGGGDRSVHWRRWMRIKGRLPMDTVGSLLPWRWTPYYSLELWYTRSHSPKSHIMNLYAVKASRVRRSFLFRACATDAMRLHTCRCALRPNVSNTFFSKWTLMFRRNVLTSSSE
jgi:hypothetical protein